MPRFPVILTNRLNADDTASNGHIPFFEILREAAGAYAAMVQRASEGLMVASDAALVSVMSEFRGELFPGEAVFDVTLTRIGSSSLTFVLELSQGGKSGATITVVLVRVNESHEGSRPLSPEQRSAFERAMALAPSAT